MTNRILLVEDDAATRTLLASTLTDMGYSVISTAGGDEALRFLYAEESCDLVLSDVMMPGMSGIELAQRTRDARPGLPLVFMTGLPNAIDIALDHGVLPLPKPFTRGDLASILDDALSQAS